MYIRFQSFPKTNNTNPPGVFVPCTLDENHPIFLAINNVDLKIDTPDGKRLQHGTGTAVYQHKSVKQKVCENLKLVLKQISGRRVLNHSLHQ